MGSFSTILRGDCLLNLKTHLPAVCMQPDSLQSKLDAGLVGLMGPMMGEKCRRTKAEAALRESEALKDFELHLADFNTFNRIIPGTRRPFLLRPRNVGLEKVQGDPVVSFELPPGAYATVFLREILDFSY